MQILQAYAKEIVSLLAPLLAWALTRFFRPKARLIYSSPHTFTFLVQEPLRDANGNILSPTQTAHTASHLIRNNGTESAENIEIVFNWKPLCINIWPSRIFAERIDPDGRYAIVLDNLAPREFVGFELLSVNNQLPVLVTVRSKQCIAKFVAMYPQPVVDMWKIRLAVALMFCGSGFIIYIALLVLQFALAGAPSGK